jgi:hypothetical protein
VKEDSTVSLRRETPTPIRTCQQLVLALTIFLGFSNLWAADNPFLGTWKFNPERSKPGDTSATLKIEAYGNNGLKFTRDIIEASGNPAHWDWSANFDDGKDYPYTGNPNYDAFSLRRIDANTIETVNKKDGKVRTTAWYSLSKDGKVLGVTTAGVNAQGKPVVFYSVYDRQ